MTLCFRHMLLTASFLLSLVQTAWGVVDEAVLATIGAEVTEGAAAGYVQDHICANCHKQLHDSYQHVGMAQSFASGADASRIEDFSQTFYHEPSQRHYQMVEENGELIFLRHQLDSRGGQINQVEMPVAWVMGSGNRARSYIYQSEWGELFLLPISWYSESKSWGMSPGFEFADHPGLHRQVTRDCMFCHNAYPEVPTGSDAHFKPETFPAQLPEGTGCQRCHGPGAEHISQVLTGGGVEAIRSAIVNPAKLSASERDSVCFQCHMLPAVSMAGALVTGRHSYSFRPGEKLTDYVVHMDVQERGVDQRDRFEINHHGYRLWQSSCYRESQSELTCISCHNPHEKPDSVSFRKSVGEVCSSCHEDAQTLHKPATDIARQQCADCHMPTRRTLDVINVTMTDHRIATGPFDKAALTAPLQAEVRAVAGIDVLDFAEPPVGDEAQIYRMLSTLRSKRSMEAAERVMRGLLERSTEPYPIARIELSNAQFSLGQYQVAEQTARAALAEDSSQAAAFKALGVSLIGQGRFDEAAAALSRSLQLQGDPEVHFNLAAAYLSKQSLMQAEAQLDAALELRPTLAAAWKFKALILSARDDTEQARQALVRAIELQPVDLSAYRDLIDLLRRMGNAADAARYDELARRISKTLSQ